jgi:tripartite-type tricarboxylate transporter receptor subunit TctC
MKMKLYPRSYVVGLALCAILAASFSTSAIAQDYPTKPIRIIAPFPAGGTVDLIARVLADKLTQAWGQAVVVENKVGAGGIVGSDIVAKAKPDGYTLLVVAMPHAVNASLYKTLPYDTLRDFTPISLLGSQPLMLVVNPSVPAKSVADLIAMAKASPGKINYASGGNGGSQHLAMELFKGMAQVDLVHIPYKGNVPALVDVMGGQVPVMFDQTATVLPQVRAGKVRALAISSAKRSATMPDLPTVAEAGLPGYESTAWFGFLGPAGMPKEVVAKLSGAIIKILNSPEVNENLTNRGIDVIASTPVEYDAFMKTEVAKWATVVKASDLRVD